MTDKNLNTQESEDFIKEVEFAMEWFCDKTVDPYPEDDASKDKILKRMMNLGWLRQSEYELYKQVTKKEDD